MVRFPGNNADDSSIGKQILYSQLCDHITLIDRMGELCFPCLGL